MAVRIRMKKMGRTHRPFYRVCATDKHTPRDGRVLEELGTYDTSIQDTDARAVLVKERIDYWLSVGAQPSDRVSVLIKKYGTNGTHVEAQDAALEKLAQPRLVPDAGAPASLPKKEEPAAEKAPEKTEEAAASEVKTEAKPAEKAEAKSEAKPEEAVAKPEAEAPAESQAKPEEAKAEEASKDS